MSKLIRITESQLHEIIGNGAYLNNQDTTNEYRFGGMEINANGVTGNYTDNDVKAGKPVTADKIAKSLARKDIRGLGRTSIPSRLMIPESNQDLSGKQKTFQLSQNTIDKLKERLMSYNGRQNDKGVKRAKNLINKERISYDDAYRVLDDIENGNDGQILDPDGTLEKELQSKINVGTSISKNNKQMKMNRGENIIKTHAKTGLKGGAHTPKNNIIGITYEN